MCNLSEKTTWNRCRAPRPIRAPILDKYEREGSPYYSTARLWDDGILDPVETRRVLGLALSACLNRLSQTTQYGVFRM